MIIVFSVIAAAIIVAVILGTVVIYGNRSPQPKVRPSTIVAEGPTIVTPSPPPPQSPPTPTSVPKPAILGQVLRTTFLIAAVVAVTILVATLTLSIFGLSYNWTTVENWIDQHPEIWILWEKVKSWFNQHPEIWILTIAAIILISAVTTGVWRNLARLTLLVLLLIFLTPFLLGVGGWVDRVFNYGDWSEPANYVRTVQNGTVTMRPGVVENFYVVGEVTLINPNPYTCLGIGPENTFWIVPARFASGEENPRRNVIRPKSGEKEMAFVRVKPASECS